MIGRRDLRTGENQIRFGIERFQPIPRLKAVVQEGEATGEQRAQRRGLHHILSCSPGSSTCATNRRDG